MCSAAGSTLSRSGANLGATGGATEETAHWTGRQHHLRRCVYEYSEVLSDTKSSTNQCLLGVVIVSSLSDDFANQQRHIQYIES